MTTAALLSHVIVGSALEQMDMDRLIKEVGFAVSERVHGGVGSVDEVARELQEKLMLRGEATKQLKFESIHVSLGRGFAGVWRLADASLCGGSQRETPETRHNVETFVNAESLAAAKPNLKKVRDASESALFRLCVR